MDPSELFPDGFHPVALNKDRYLKGKAKHFSRTERPPKYYVADLGRSRYYDPVKGQPLDLPVLGADKSVPEFQGEGYNALHDPFRTDIYYLGNLLREDFLEVTILQCQVNCQLKCLGQPVNGTEWIWNLVVDMVDPNPARRPTIEEVLERYTKLRNSLTPSKLRSRVVDRQELRLHWLPIRISRAISHYFRNMRYHRQGIPAVPCRRDIQSLSSPQVRPL